MLSDITLVSFSGSDIHRKLQEEQASLYSKYFKNSILFTKEQIEKTKYYKDNEELFKYVKYFGYFVWKPFIINQALEQNEQVLYLDSNFRIKDISLFEKLVSEKLNNEGIFVAKYPHYNNKQWTKRDTFIKMGCDETRYHDAKQIWTSILGFIGQSEILKEYSNLCTDAQLVNEDPSLLGEEFPEYIEHRWEQSVLSILVEKYKTPSCDYLSLEKIVYKEYPKELNEQKRTEKPDLKR